MAMIFRGDVEEFLNSGQFDEKWYRTQYPDVDLSGMSPVEHYLWVGARLGRPPRDPDEAMPGDDLISTAFRPSPAKPTSEGVRSSPAGERRLIAELPDHLRREIIESGLFNEEYYVREYQEEIDFEDDYILDYLNAHYLGRDRDPNALFSTSYYKTMHPDVVNMHPFVHYIQYGQEEGRAAFSPYKVNEYLGRTANVAIPRVWDILSGYRKINILYWAEGNFFLSDVARYLEFLLKEQGIECELHTQTPSQVSEEVLDLVVAPHEFCACGPGLEWSDERCRRAAYLNTEQWHTSWFALSLRYLKKSQVGLLDLNPSSAAGLTGLGMPTAFLPLLPLEGSCFDVPDEEIDPAFTRLKFIKPLTYPADVFERPYDVAFVAVMNDRRGKALAKMAECLSRHDSFLHCPRFVRPVQSGDPDMLNVRSFTQIARNSKIMLNIHQGDSHYLEWQRVFLVGIMEGCLVLTEPCTPNQIVKPGENYLECNIDDMPTMLEYLLETDAGRKTMIDIYNNNKKLKQRILGGERFL